MSAELEAKLSVNSEEEEDTEYKVTLLNLCGTIFGLLFYVFDIGSDIMLAAWYFQMGYYKCGACTIILIYLATVIDTVVSFFKNEFQNQGSRFWLQYISFSLVNVWGVKIICSLIVCQYRAYKSQRVSIDMYKIIEEKNLRVARLKLCEGIFETLPLISLYMYLFWRVEELRSFKLHFVSEYDDIQPSVDFFNVPGLLLMTKICYGLITVTMNLYKIGRIKLSSLAMITFIGYLNFNGVVRGLLLPSIFLYWYHAAVVVLLHVSVGGIHWYRNISKENQSVYKRVVKSIAIGIVWFIVPFYSMKHKITLLTLYIIHFIGNSLAIVTLELIVKKNYAYTFLLAILQTISLVCWLINYFCYFEETKEAMKSKKLYP